LIRRGEVGGAQSHRGAEVPTVAGLRRWTHLTHPGGLMAAQSGTAEQERDLVVKCIGEAYDALRVLPGVDANGPVLVWLAEKFVASYRPS
jgi:hypothetical protein